MKKNKILTLQNTSEKNIIAAIVKKIQTSKTFFIAGHKSPDGDALGSGLALASALRSLGKKVSHCSIDPVPEDMVFMPGSKTIKCTKKLKGNFDCAIILECKDFERMGDIISCEQAKFVINIDHHLIHNNYGDINYVVPTSSSVSELIYNILVALKIKLTKMQAENLYIGIVTDTGRFQQINTTSNSHLVVSQLLKYGVNSNKICKQLFLTTKINKLKLYGFALSNIQTALNGKFVYIKLNKKMFEESKALDSDTDGIINFYINVPGAFIGCVAKEIEKNVTKVSFRSIEKINLLNIVKVFKGGGHKNAAGCTINSNLDDSINKIIKVCKEYV